MHTATHAMEWLIQHAEDPCQAPPGATRNLMAASRAAAETSIKGEEARDVLTKVFKKIQRRRELWQILSLSFPWMEMEFSVKKVVLFFCVCSFFFVFSLFLFCFNFLVLRTKPRQVLFPWANSSRCPQSEQPPSKSYLKLLLETNPHFQAILDNLVV